jgi:Ca2+-binding protein (EF-Hand superfamily)
MVFTSKEKSPIVVKNAQARMSKRVPTGKEQEVQFTAVTDRRDNTAVEAETNYVHTAENGKSERPLDIRETEDAMHSDTTAITNYTKYEETGPKNDIPRARFLAEQGPTSLKVLAFAAGIGMVFTSILDFFEQMKGVNVMTPDFALISAYTWVFGFFIMGLEGSALMLHIPTLHRMVSNYMKILRFLWGRGLFMIFAGSLELSLSTDANVICGACVMSLGLLMFIIGVIFKLLLNRKLRGIPKEGEIKTQFEFFDADQDGFIDKEQFRDLIIHMDIQDFEDIDHDSEFHMTDKDNDGLISFTEFKEWMDAMNKRKKNLMDMFESVAYYIV